MLFSSACQSKLHGYGSPTLTMHDVASVEDMNVLWFDQHANR